MKRTPLHSKTPLRGRKGGKVKSKAPKPKKGQYVAPKWFKAIKPGPHGNTPHQKRLWKVVSETYREEDFKKWGNWCAICGVHFERWQDGQLGHWLAYSCCNSWFKYERMNLALICAGCNRGESAVTQRKLGETLQQRYGEDVLLWIELTNQNIEYKGKKQELWMCVDLAARVAPHLVKEE